MINGLIAAVDKGALVKKNSCTFNHLTMKYFQTVFIVLVLAVSCTKLVELDFETNSKLTFNCILNPDSLITANLVESRGLNSVGDFIAIEGAEIMLFEDENLLGNMLDIENGNYFFAYYPKPGHSYKIEIYKSGFPVSVAKTIVPN